MENVYYDEKPMVFQRKFARFYWKRDYENEINYRIARPDTFTEAIVAVTSEFSKAWKIIMIEDEKR